MPRVGAHSKKQTKHTNKEQRHLEQEAAAADQGRPRIVSMPNTEYQIIYLLAQNKRGYWKHD